MAGIWYAFLGDLELATLEKTSEILWRTYQKTHRTQRVNLWKKNAKVQPQIRNGLSAATHPLQDPSPRGCGRGVLSAMVLQQLQPHVRKMKDARVFENMTKTGWKIRVSKWEPCYFLEESSAWFLLCRSLLNIPYAYYAIKRLSREDIGSEIIVDIFCLLERNLVACLKEPGNTTCFFLQSNQSATTRSCCGKRNPSSQLSAWMPQEVCRRLINRS